MWLRKSQVAATGMDSAGGLNVVMASEHPASIEVRMATVDEVIASV